MVILISQAAKISRDDLEDLGPVKQPLSQPASALIGRKYIDEDRGVDSMGIWECSPGRWERTIMQEEFAHFLSGRARFIPTDGEPIEIRAGDTVWFSANTAGIWEIEAEVRKVYVVIDRPTLWHEFGRFFKTKLKRWLGLPSPSRKVQRGAAISADPVAVWRSSDEQAQRF
jgi:hypothetical protein